MLRFLQHFGTAQIKAFSDAFNLMLKALHQVSQKHREANIHVPKVKGAQGSSSHAKDDPTWSAADAEITPVAA